jgi:exopolysaccharide biosynthesis WecB/TagA/CpsF family protein
MINNLKILGIRIDTLTKSEVLERVKDFLDSSKQSQIATVNAEFVMAAQTDNKFREILNNCALNITDGVGLIWAAKFLSKSQTNTENRVDKRGNKVEIDQEKQPSKPSAVVDKIGRNIKLFFRLVYTGASLVFWPPYARSQIPERISGVDLMIDICQLAARLDKKVFLLGGKPGVAQATAEELSLKIPNLKIYWKLEIGNWKFKASQKDDIEIVKNINEIKPDILFVALNHPKAQYWIDENLDKLSSVKVAMGVGGAFDFLSGKVSRAPKVFQNLGLEWLYRLIRQPWRLPRILTATVKFIYKVVSD